MNYKKFEDSKNLVLEELNQALSAVDEAAFDELIELIESSDKIFFVGVGRVMLSLQAIAKRLAHLGYKTHCVGEITEPAMTDKDLLIVGSGSGNTLVPVAIANKAKYLGAKIVHIGSNSQSKISAITDLMVRIPVRSKMYLADEIDSKQAMTSLFEQSLLLLGDILAKCLIERKGLELQELWRFHANLE